MALQTANRDLLLHLLAENELIRREIGKRLGCSAERVKQLEQKLLGRTGNEARREKRQKKLRARSLQRWICKGCETTGPES